jgi:hypothetical protein
MAPATGASSPPDPPVKTVVTATATTIASMLASKPLLSLGGGGAFTAAMVSPMISFGWYGQKVLASLWRLLT